MKVTVLFLLAACLLAFSATAHAGTYKCTVDQVGPAGATTSAGSKIYLTDTAATPGWTGSKAFKLPADRSKEFLAVGLAAMANSAAVKVTTDTGLTTITTIYLQKK